MPLPYGDRFRDEHDRLIPVGGYRLDKAFSVGGVKIVKYHRRATTPFGEGARRIVLWDAEGIGAWKELPLPAARARVYVKRGSYRVRWLPYRSVVGKRWTNQASDGRFLMAKPATEGYALLVADRTFKEAWAYGLRGKKSPLT